MFSRSQLIILGAVFLVVIFFTLVFLGVFPGLRQDIGPADQLVIWGVHDSTDIFSGLLNSAKAVLPNVNAVYIKKDVATYESDLLNALALGTAPDIIMIHNSWLPHYANKLYPAPVDIFDLKAIRDLYPAVVEQDFTSADGRVFALPLYLDTLALFYNRDLLAAANLDHPPTTWEEFKTAVNRLKQIDPAGKIQLAGAAIGGSAESVNVFADLLSLLMLQNGTEMVSSDFNRATFASFSNRSFRPGLSAFDFYLSFANPRSSDYTWNDRLVYSIDGFAEGRVAMIFNYSHQIPVLRNKNPFLDFAIAPVPQLADAALPVNYPNYWGLAVLNRSPRRDLAWSLVSFLTSNPAAAGSYAAAANRPPALRSLLSSCRRDLNLSAFCEQTLTARSWPKPDPARVDTAFSAAVTEVLSGRLSTAAALKQAEDEVTRLLQAR